MQDMIRRDKKRPVILITEPAYFTSVLPRIRRIGRVILGSPARAVIARLIAGCDAAVIRVETHLDSELLERATRLKLIASATTGMNHVDVDAARARGIRIVHLHGTHTVPTAEHTIALMLSLLRRIAEVQPAMRQGRWDRTRWIGTQLAGKKIGIVGLGRIGSKTAQMTRALGAEVLAYDPYIPHARFGRAGAGRTTNLATLLQSSDIVTIHAALTDETRGMIDSRALRRMKAGSFLINTARGEILDDRALIGALKAGRLAGAALDVFSEEPLPPSHPLRVYARSRGNLILTPHLGASTREAVAEAAMEMADVLEEFFRTRREFRSRSPR